jgi:hypothetical protein
MTKPQGPVRLEVLGKFKKKINYLIGIRIRHVPTCSIALQPSTLTLDSHIQNCVKLKKEKKLFLSWFCVLLQLVTI